jgi:hypothetical protein
MGSVVAVGGMQLLIFVIPGREVAREAEADATAMP